MFTCYVYYIYCIFHIWYIYHIDYRYYICYIENAYYTIYAFFYEGAAILSAAQSCWNALT